MANVRKTITASLGSLNDKDLFEFLDQMESKGVTVSKLVKDALRYYQANYISNKKKQKNDIDYNRIESIVEKTVKKALEEASIASGPSLKISEEMESSELVNPQAKSLKQEAKLLKGRQIKKVKDVPELEEQKTAKMDEVQSVEESSLTAVEPIEETTIIQRASQIEQEVQIPESQLDDEVSIEQSVEAIAADEVKEDIREVQEKEIEKMVEETQEDQKESLTVESLTKKEEVDNSDLEALVSGMITIR